MIKKIPLIPFALAGGLTLALAFLASVIYAAATAWGGQWAVLLADAYPGLDLAAPLWRSLLVGGLYGFAEGAIWGLVFAWLFNAFAARARKTRPTPQPPATPLPGG